ncbi:MAG TPA: amidohydrolase family protein, partial [Acidimicrobiales bacterium]|nr:amidohydrolase family protein [Acidimicrobiales bacterium]
APVLDQLRRRREHTGLHRPLPLCGANRIFWASDYPHPDAKIPGVTKELAESIADLPVDDQARIAGGNAVDLYRL